MLGEAVLAPECLGDRAQHEGGVPQRRHPDPEHAISELGHQLGGNLDRQPRLARAAGPRQGEQPRPVPEECDDLGELALAADEGTCRAGQVRVRKRLQGREALVPELVDPDRLDEVLQAVLAEVGQLGADEFARRLREQHLAAVPGRRDARGQMDGLSDVPLVRPVWYPGVDADSNADRAGAERVHRFVGRANRARRRREGDEERISLGIHLDTPVRCERAPEGPAMFRERVRVRLGAQFVQQLRRTLHIAEQEGHRSRGKITPHGPIMRQTRSTRPRISRRSAPPLSSWTWTR